MLNPKVELDTFNELTCANLDLDLPVFELDPKLDLELPHLDSPVETKSASPSPRPGSLLIV